MAGKRKKRIPESRIVRNRRLRANSLTGKAERFMRQISSIPRELSLRLQALDLGNILPVRADPEITKDTPVKDQITPNRRTWSKDVGLLEDIPGLSRTPSWWGVLPEESQLKINLILHQVEIGYDAGSLFDQARKTELENYAGEVVTLGLKGLIKLGMGRERSS